MSIILSEVFRYSGSFAKVSAMSGRLLTDEDYDALLSKTKVSDVAVYLKSNTSYAEYLIGVEDASVHRGELEAALELSGEREFVKLFKYEKGKNKKFLQVFILRHEIETLKEMLRMIESDILYTFADTANGYYKKHMTIDPTKLAASSDRAQFIENLRGTPYYDLLKMFATDEGHFNIFSMEMTLDVYYFNQVWRTFQKNLSKGDRELVLHSFGIEVDLLNIMWILRCKKFFDTPREIIYAFIIPKRYRLKNEYIAAMVDAKSYEEAMAEVENTPYKGVFGNDDFFEQYYYKYVISCQHRLSRQNPYSIIKILYYIHAKSTEIANIIKLIEGIRYNLDADVIKKYLIRGEPHVG